MVRGERFGRVDSTVFLEMYARKDYTVICERFERYKRYARRDIIVVVGERYARRDYTLCHPWPLPECQGGSGCQATRGIWQITVG